MGCVQLQLRPAGHRVQQALSQRLRMPCWRDLGGVGRQHCHEACARMLML